VDALLRTHAFATASAAAAPVRPTWARGGNRSGGVGLATAVAERTAPAAPDEPVRPSEIRRPSSGDEEGASAGAGATWSRAMVEADEVREADARLLSARAAAERLSAEERAAAERLSTFARSSSGGATPTRGGLPRSTLDEARDAIAASREAALRLEEIGRSARASYRDVDDDDDDHGDRVGWPRAEAAERPRADSAHSVRSSYGGGGGAQPSARRETGGGLAARPTAASDKIAASRSFSFARRGGTSAVIPRRAPSPSGGRDGADDLC
jgi:hypothetical protein